MNVSRNCIPNEQLQYIQVHTDLSSQYIQNSPLNDLPFKKLVSIDKIETNLSQTNNKLKIQRKEIKNCKLKVNQLLNLNLSQQEFAVKLLIAFVQNQTESFQ
ncbi:Hypothetical_protein [Hexamita inflata]|uniref:Hypothetical_protein n=1 Tax=Hexamita inflata TaxID=28002 RepID=A0ABP1HJS0_9EUKA